MRILDDDRLPVVSIKADHGEIAENEGPPTFKLSATGFFVNKTLAIKATPRDQGGQFIADDVEHIRPTYQVSFTDPDGDYVYSGDLQLTSQQFLNDTVGETNASIHLSLAANPTVYELGSPARGFMKIWDDDAPELKVVAGDTILEAAGAMANFTFSSKASPNRSVVVYADLVETGDFIAVEGINRSYTLDFTAGKKEATVSIPIINNSYPESDGTITLTLKPDSANPPTYMVAADPNNSAVVNVKDDESLPVVSIMADSGGIGENANQTPFVLQATGLTATTTLMINATPAEDGHDFLTNTVAGLHQILQ